MADRKKAQGAEKGVKKTVSKKNSAKEEKPVKTASSKKNGAAEKSERSKSAAAKKTESSKMPSKTGGVKASRRRSSAAKTPTSPRGDLHSFTPEYLVLMQKDPNWMQVFWDVNAQRLAEAQERGDKLVLRMYDVSKDLTVRSRKARAFVEIEVPWDARSWYVQNSGGGSVTAVLGVSGSGSAGFEPLLESSGVFGASAQGQGLYVGGENGRFVRASLGAYGLGGSSELGLSSWSLGELTSSLTGSSEFLSSWAPLSSGVLSVPGMHWHGPGKDFFLWVKTRLIVYGGTRPDAHLQVRGQPFPLNPDGTFSLEMDLPDSTQVIPVFATDKDGDFPTTIVPIVVKRTE